LVANVKMIRKYHPLVLFVVLQSELELDDALRQTIGDSIRNNTTPRHGPAKILQVGDIPRTLSGKIVEPTVRNVVHGQPVSNTDALAILRHWSCIGT
jgi:acetoacetyl-CoA synthetase